MKNVNLLTEKSKDKTTKLYQSSLVAKLETQQKWNTTRGSKTELLEQINELYQIFWNDLSCLKLLPNFSGEGPSEVSKRFTSDSAC